jgi:hypothetical protein
MNKGNWFLLILGLAIIWKFYSQVIFTPKRILEIWEPVQNSIIGDEANRKCDEARAQLKTYRSNAIGFAVLFLISITNWQFNYVSGPILFLIVGIFVSICKFNAHQIAPHLDWRYEQDVEKKTLAQNKISEGKKNLAIGIVAVLFISGFWAYRIQQDMNIQKQSAMNEVLELTDSGWCSEWWDIDTSGGVDNIVKSGGWPCIYIDSVHDITFSQDASHLNMCFFYTLKRSSGIPTNDTYSQYGYEKLCVTDSWYIDDGGWSTTTFKDKIYQRIKPDLDKNRISACNKYYYSLTEEERIVYC